MSWGVCGMSGGCLEDVWEVSGGMSDDDALMNTKHPSQRLTSVSRFRIFNEEIQVADLLICINI